MFNNSGFAPTSRFALGEVGNVKGLLNRSNFEDSLRNLYSYIELEKAGLDFNVFRYGMIGYYSLKNDHKLNDKNLITIIDFTKASTEKRFYTIDLDKNELKFHSLVAHGNRTGENLATKFSNVPHSNQSSLGFYITGETYYGSKGYSLRLDGQEKNVNDKIRSRAVVVHAADYVSEKWIKRYGRLGRSQGCPALPVDQNKEIIDVIKNKTLMFAYYNNDDYLERSAYLNFDKMIEGLEAMPVVASKEVSNQNQITSVP